MVALEHFQTDTQTMKHFDFQFYQTALKHSFLFAARIDIFSEIDFT